MNIYSFFNIILLIGFAQGFVFNIISIYTKKLKVKAHLYLNLLVFFLSLNNLEAWLNANHIRFSNYYLADLHTPWYILLAPFLYLFLSEYLGFKRKKIVFYIGITFFISLTLIKLYYLQINIATPRNILSPNLLTFNQIAEAVGFSITIGIFFYVYKMLQKKENRINEYHIDNLKWLYTFFKISLFILILWIVVLLIIAIFHKNIYHLLHISVSFLIYWIAYMGTHKQSLFTERLSLRSLKQNKIEKKTIIDNPKNEDENLYFSIYNYLAETEIYTNSQLSLEELAEKLELNKNKLSQIINQFTQKNFSNFINDFRIEKVKKHLQDKEYANYTSLAIGLEAGFNSKSTFYTAFKKQTGQTPKEWLDSQ